jgi:hypothetical protein
MQDNQTHEPQKDVAFNRVPSLFTLKQFCETHHAFTNGGMRHIIFHADSNGLAESGAIVRNGRRILINEERFFSWLEEKNKPVV